MSLFGKNQHKLCKGEQASQMFHGSPYFYNCAQSILKAFQTEFQVPDEQVEFYKIYGGGRAENGYCGALYAGLQLLKDAPEQKQALENQFRSIAGSVKCRDIRGQRGLPCKKLVEITGDLLEELQKSRVLSDS